jgi:acyl dehydratase
MTWKFMATKRKLSSPALDDAAVAEARRLLDTPIRIEQWNYEASRDAIRHYAWGLGDDNPLFAEPNYAATTRWGGIIAPPTFFFAIFDAVVAPGLPDIQWYYSGFDAEFLEPMRRNDEIVADAEYVELKEISGKKVSRMLLQTGEVVYRNQHGRVATRVLSHCYRVARLSAEGGLAYEPRATHEYTAAELAKIHDAMINEYRRGAATLFWEDARVGEAIPPIVRGPINQLDMTCYYAGAVGTSGYKSTKLKAQYTNWANHAPDRLPNNYDASYYSAAESPSIGHQIAAVATEELGMPGAYDNGPQRSGMIAVCVTNWMGDNGFLRNYSVRLRRPVIFGDTNYIGGRITGKRTEGERSLVDVELSCKNQLGDETATGSAAIELPRRNG